MHRFKDQWVPLEDRWDPQDKWVVLDHWDHLDTWGLVVLVLLGHHRMDPDLLDHQVK